MSFAQSTFGELNLTLAGGIVAISASLLASIVVYLMYHLFYGSKTIGAGVDRSFIVGGPAITALFLGIQSSIPLSLGLLGALSFVRFRTPVKDSAEIGFLLLLIAASILIAVGAYPLVIVLYLIVFIALSVQRFFQNRFSVRRYANLMISMEKDIYAGAEEQLEQFLAERMDSVRTRTVSVMDGRVSLHYQFRSKSDFAKADFIKELGNVPNLQSAEVFID